MSFKNILPILFQTKPASAYKHYGEGCRLGIYTDEVGKPYELTLYGRWLVFNYLKDRPGFDPRTIPGYHQVIFDHYYEGAINKIAVEIAI